jgi:hypothetical protein
MSPAAWVGCALTIIGYLLLIQAERPREAVYACVMGGVGSLFWIASALASENYPILAVNTFFLGVHAYGTARNLRK